MESASELRLKMNFGTPRPEQAKGKHEEKDLKNSMD